MRGLQPVIIPPSSPLREIYKNIDLFSEYFYSLPNLDCNYTFLIGLELNRNPFGAKLSEKL